MDRSNEQSEKFHFSGDLYSWESNLGIASSSFVSCWLPEAVEIVIMSLLNTIMFVGYVLVCHSVLTNYIKKVTTVI